jgi:hypothetical protein
VPKISIAPAVAPALVFVKGQLWKFGERCLQIHHVGKLLVSHRGVALDNKPSHSPIRMMRMEELRDFLVEQHAVLVAA